MIRTATHEDIPQILDLGHSLHLESIYSSMPFDERKVEALILGLIDGNGVVFVSDVSGEITGGIAGGITEFWFCNERVAFDYSFFIHPDHRGGMTAIRLMTAFFEWARLRQAKEVHMGITTGINTEATSRFYEKMGMTKVGPLFKKGL